MSNKATTYNSGVLFASPKGYSMKFPKAGKYQIVCLIHPAMNGTVEVVAPSKQVDAPAKAARQGQDEANADVVEAVNLHLNQPVAEADPKNAVMAVGAGTKNYSLFAFYPQALSVKAGTTITFKMGGPNEVHNVGFGPYGVQTAFIHGDRPVPAGAARDAEPGRAGADLRHRSGGERRVHVQRQHAARQRALRHAGDGYRRRQRRSYRRP